jgi:hypothetical protein
MPSGSITFTDTDVIGECTIENCGYEDDFYGTSQCISISGWPTTPTDIRPCWCDGTFTVDIAATATTTDVENICGTDTCLGGSAGTSYTILDSFDCSIVVDGCCVGGPYSDCYSFDTNCFGFSFSGPEDCINPQLGYEVACSTGTWLPVVTAKNSTTYWWASDCAGTESQEFTYDPLPCYAPFSCNSGNYTNSCCWSFVCDDGVIPPIIVFDDKYEFVDLNGTLLDFDISCTFTAPSDICIASPSWTINLA